MIILLRAQIFPVKWKAFEIWILLNGEFGLLSLLAPPAGNISYWLVAAAQWKRRQFSVCEYSGGSLQIKRTEGGETVTGEGHIHLIRLLDGVLQSITGNVITLRCFSHTYNRLRHALFYAHNAWFTEQPLPATVII